MQGLEHIERRLGPCTLAAVIGLMCCGQVVALERFIRGDVNQDGHVQIDDAIGMLRHLFWGDYEIRCLEAADFYRGTEITPSDASGILRFLFLNGQRPAPPFPNCGFDRFYRLGCEEFDACEPTEPGTFLFAGRPFVADGVFLVAESSASTRNGEINRIKQALVIPLTQLPDGTHFSITFFSGVSEVASFPTTDHPATASAESIDQAIEWLLQRTPSGGNCPRGGLIAALNFAEKSHAQRKVLLLIPGDTACTADDSSYFRETLEAVRLRNAGGTRIYATGGFVGEHKREFLRQLVSENGGELIE